MNAAYQTIIAASDDDRLGLFLAAANRIGTTVQNIEKDFWVCWTLDALFHRLKPGGPRLLFKGGTSLSKGFGLISRFSEDIDITVFRDDLGEGASFEELEKLSSGRKRSARLDAIKAACQDYINGRLREELNALAQETMERAGNDPARLRVVLDSDDKDKQSLLIHYPSAVERSGYISPLVKIESGAKSALDPHMGCTVTPYVGPDTRKRDALAVTDVTTIDPQRTFIDKILILHGMTFFFEAHSELRGNGRMSRHYYDVHQLMNDAVGEKACSDDALIVDCVGHAHMFFHRANTGLEHATRGAFRLRPSAAMRDPLRRDYDSMTSMIFGDVPDFDTVLESIARAEDLLNRKA
jgi:Nucleotidyl transferase AbiEii toxin, Type IV TA system